MTKFKKGMRVKIISDEATTKIGWMTSRMKPLVGTIATVKNSGKINDTDVVVKGYYWHEDDIKLLGENAPPIPDPQLFDIEKLDIR